MKKILMTSALILGLVSAQMAFSATTYMPNTQKAIQNTQNAIKTDLENQKKQAELDAQKRQQQREAELKKKAEPAAKAKSDYEATKKDLNNIMKRYSK